MAAEGEVGLIDIGQGSNTTEYRSRRARDSRNQQAAVTAAAAAYKQRRTSYRQQAAKGRCGGTEAIQYSNTGAAAPDISINYSPWCARLENSKMNSIFFLLLGLATSGLLQGRNAKKKQKYRSKSRN